MITIGTRPGSRPAGRRRCAAQPRAVYAAVAIHPNETADAARLGGTDEVLAELAELARAAAGAGGRRDRAGLLPRPRAARGAAGVVPRAHRRSPSDTGKALVIHDRDAHDDVLRHPGRGRARRTTWSSTASPATPRWPERCADAGYVLSFAGNVTFKNAQPLREAAAVAPAEPDPGRDRRAVPHAGAEPGQAERAGHGRAHRCAASPSVKQHGRRRAVRAVTATGERVFGPW